MIGQGCFPAVIDRLSRQYPRYLYRVQANFNGFAAVAALREARDRN